MSMQMKSLNQWKFRALSNGIHIRASLEEMTGRGWIFVAVIVGVVLLLGPMAISLVKTNVGSSLNTVSSNFNFPS